MITDFVPGQWWDSYPTTGKHAYYLSNGMADGQPDKFTYKLLNKSGTFYFMKNSNGIGYKIVPVPYDNIAITFDGGSFEITDSDGTKYQFGGPMGGHFEQLRANGMETSGSIDAMGTCVNCQVTTWKCKKIINSTGTDEIIFSYSPKTVTTYRLYQDQVEYYSNNSPCGLNNYVRSDQDPAKLAGSYQNLISLVPFHEISSPKYMVLMGNKIPYFHVPYVDGGTVVDKIYPMTGVNNSTQLNVAGLSLSEITFRGGKVQFSGADELSAVQVFDYEGREVKKVSFYYSFANALYATESKHYNGTDFQGTRYLDSIHIGNGDDTYDRYAMFYTNKFCFGNHLKGHDAWGYSNPSTIEIAQANAFNGSVLSLPTGTIIEPRYYFDLSWGCSNYIENVPITIGGDNWAETSSEDHMRRGLLKRLIFPTGGYSDFDFEANKYEEIFSDGVIQQRLPQVSGGLRIRSITTYDTNGGVPVSQKYYRYGELEQGTGVLVNKPQLSPFSTTPGGGNYYFGAVSYEQELNYLAGDAACTNPSCLNTLAVEKKTTYQSASALDYTYSNGSPIYYNKISEYKQDLGESSGKIVYEYYPPNTFHDFTSAPLFPENRIPETNIPFLKTSGLLGAQKSITFYKPLPGSKFTPTHKKEFEYLRHLNPEQIYVAAAFQKVIYNVVEGSYSGEYMDFYSGHPSNNFTTYVYGIASGKLLLEKETETRFESSGNLINITTYEYNRLPYLQVSAINKKNSKGQVIRHAFKYPYDYPGSIVYDDMVTWNRINLPIEEIQTNETLGKEISRKKTNYDQQSAGFGFQAPASVQSSIAGNLLKTDITFNKYDQYGNVLQLITADNISVSYIWGYKSLYPVAELKGVDYNSIPVSYLSNAQINNPVSDNSLRELLEELRDSFIGGQLISTCTYKPLIGITSQTAPNGLKIFYEYDPVGKLVRKLDHNQNIIKSFEYKTLGPSVKSINKGFYTNVPTMRTRSFQCSPGVHQVYNYVVRGGKYSADNVAFASSQAEHEAESNNTIPVLPACPSTSGNALIKLAGIYTHEISEPRKVEIDFLQEGSVVATQKVQYNYVYEGPLDYSSIYLPAGTYQISIRPNPDINYTNGFLRYLFRSLNDQTDFNFESGQTIIIEPDKQYEIEVNNLML
ncbi:hypothetical protein [Desertivirga xinjiangensis]|uniref:hypothetical protein n=1 Tax=Desertivirga xinjiangensis TaxID=539206 RepID=UPI00210DB375|nr:hypothetical protein [Pedobacter xinjiangensis]